MTSGRGATIDWTSYNYPSCIRLGAACTGTSSDYSSFSYTPDRQYWRQISNYTSGGTATTLYIGGLLEKVTTASGTDYRHMIRAGGSTIIVSRQSSGTNTINYVTSDHLGSSSAITNSAGGILVNSSFDAFGRRRGSSWTGNPSAGDWTAIASTTRRGFTEHTMLDNLNLTHMNGRVYDQMLGRFISADPYIPHPLKTQSYNRYTYVRNNPLSRSDPSGFEDIEEIVVTGTTPSNDSGWTGVRGTDFYPGRDVSAPSSPSDRDSGEVGGVQNSAGDETLPEVEVCGDCRPKDLGPDPFVRAPYFYELGGMHWSKFIASEGWGFNRDKVTEFADQGPQIAFLAPEQAIQRKDPSLGNEELSPDLFINTVNGDFTFGDVGTLKFDEPWKSSGPAPTSDPVRIPFELPPPPDFEVEGD